MNLVAPVVKHVAVQSGMLCLNGCRNPPGRAALCSTRSRPSRAELRGRKGQAGDHGLGGQGLIFSSWEKAQYALEQRVA